MPYFARYPYLSFILCPSICIFLYLSIDPFTSILISIHLYISVYPSYSMFLALYLFLYLSYSQVLQFVLNTFRNFIFEPSLRLFTLSSLIELSILLHSPTTVKSLHSSVFYYSPSFADLQSLPSSPSLHFLPALPAAKVYLSFLAVWGKTSAASLC